MNSKVCNNFKLQITKEVKHNSHKTKVQAVIEHVNPLFLKKIRTKQWSNQIE